MKGALFECGEIRRHCALFDGAPPLWSTKGTCRIHHFMKEAESVLQDFLRSKTLADLSREFEHKAPARFIRDTGLWFDVSRPDERHPGAQRAPA
jgi:DNA-binding IscR family transcriptional regulator